MVNVPVPINLDDMVQAQVNELKVAGELYVFKPETRCRVCLSEDSRVMVNTMLAQGITYRTILKACEGINQNRRKNAQITYNSVFNHAKEHFNIQEPARAVYRQILEKRAQEHELNFIEAVGSAVNHISYLESVMLKGYEQLNSDQENVSVEMGMQAAVKLYEISKKDANVQQAAELIHQNNKIIAAVKEIVPEEYYEAILRRLSGEDDMSVRPNVIDVDVDDDEDDDGYDPGVGNDEDEDF